MLVLFLFSSLPLMVMCHNFVRPVRPLRNNPLPQKNAATTPAAGRGNPHQKSSNFKCALAYFTL